MGDLATAEELDHPPLVGRYYRVKVIYVPRTIGWGRHRLWWPVHGPAHTDIEIGGGGAYRHYHLFIPFLSDTQLDGVMSAHGVGTEYGQVALHEDPDRFSNSFTLEKWARRRCHREWTTYPYAATAKMREKIAYAHKPIQPGCRVCPHRGMNLALVPPDENGIVTCPGHGLRWHLATGTPAGPGEVDTEMSTEKGEEV